MSRSLIRLWALFALVMSTPGWALGLGEIRLNSALNEPLRAKISLLSATQEELENLTIRMATPEIFARYGLDRPAYLQSVRFRIIPSGRSDGNVVELTSSEPITEPFLTFLVEASWSRGRLLREYTVLLDPPTFAPPPSAPVTQSVQPPVQSDPADSGTISRPAPSQTPAPSPAPTRQPAPSQVAPPATTPAASEPFDTTPGGDYTVRAGDTLWGIASRVQPDGRLSINQTMLAIYQANPGAFEGNINRLSAGASLRIPSADEVFRITRAEAFAEVERQNSAWTGGGSTTSTASSGPSLELVPPDEDSLSGDETGVYDGPDLADDAGQAAGDPDDVRIAELEDLLADYQDGLVVVSDNELAALQRELAELRGEPLPELPADTAADATADDTGTDAQADEGDIFVDDADPVADTDEVVDADADVLADDSAETPVVDAEPAAQPTATPVVQSRRQESLVDTILGYLTGFWGWVAGAVILVLLALVFFARRAARGGRDEDPTGMWTSLDEDATSASGTMEAPVIGDETIVVEESGGTLNEQSDMTATMELPPDVAPAASRAAESASDQTLPVPESPEPDPSIEQTFSSDTALNLDQSDPIAEADFHMAYGLYDQAADLINGALAVEPERTDLVAKLCEIYFVWGNRDAFIDAAERFKALLGDSEDPEWDKTVIMGQQLAGDHPLFSQTPAGATKEVDLAFDDDGDAELDMNLAGADATGEVLDLGAAGGIEADGGDGLDFVFDDEESGSTMETAQMPAPDADDDPFAAAFAEPDLGDDAVTQEVSTDFEAPTEQMPAMPGSDDVTAEMPTIETELDSGDTTASQALDTSFDGLAETAEVPAIGDDEATRLASLDDAQSDMTAEIDLDDLGLDLDGLGNDLDATAESEALDIDDMDMEFDASSTTGINEAIDDNDITGRNEAVEEDATNLLDATGHTQILPEDFAVDTTTGTHVEEALSDADATMLAPANDDAETLLASLDDDDDDIEFAETAALSEDVLEDAAPGSTDLDLDLDDLTAALKVSSEEGDTVNQAPDEATLEQPRPSANGDDSPTAAIAPEDLSDDLHDARTMTEVGTKLDLARAYVDMGDPNGARSILEEVLDEGDESQRQQAQQLIDSLPA